MKETTLRADSPIQFEALLFRLAHPSASAQAYGQHIVRKGTDDKGLFVVVGRYNSCD